MDLLPLFYESVVLGDTLKGELVHKIDLIGTVEELLLEVLDSDGESGREEQDLSLLGEEVDQLLDEGLEFGGE